MPGWQMGRSRYRSASMPFALAFRQEALREWQALSAWIQEQFKKTLAERLIAPQIPARKLSGSTGRYKIQLRAAGFRLVYAVRDQQVLVLCRGGGQAGPQGCPSPGWPAPSSSPHG